MAENKNIILLTVDALRADHVSYHGYDRRTTPFIDSLVSESFTFRTAIAPSSHTREAVPALLSGQNPTIFANDGYRMTTPNIGGVLSRHGHRTAAFHSNPYLSRAYGYGDGFDKFDDDLLLGQNRLLALAQTALNKLLMQRGDFYARADRINNRALSWLDQAPEPFFLWNHYMDVHGPYNPPQGYDIFLDEEISGSTSQDLYQRSIDDPGSISEEDHRRLVDAYDGEIQYLDEQIRVLFEKLKRRNLLDDTLVILTADHGDAFGEQGYYGHPRDLHEGLLHVPLLIHDPQRDKKVVKDIVTTRDVPATILSWAGIEDSDIIGNSLWEVVQKSEVRTGTAYASSQGLYDDEGKRLFSVRDDGYKWILKRTIDSNEIVSEQLFSLENGKETHIENHEVNSNQLNVLLEKLRTRSRDLVSRMDDAPEESQDVNEEVSARLEALGYK